MGSTVEIALRHRLSRVELALELSLRRESLALVGPSGAGKSSILRAVAGLMRPDSGRIRLGDHVVLDTERGIDVPPDRRRVGLVFQDGALFPHLTAQENVAFGMARAGRGSTAGRDQSVVAVLELFGIAGLARSKPGRLSGGERQRVALARAVASDPFVLLLDEPLSALDPATKVDVADELHRHLSDLALPTILVSHDFADVLGLTDRVAVLEAGTIVQEGRAAELLQAPASPFVAAFAGVNYFQGAAERRGTLTEVRADGGRARFLSTDQASGPVGVVVPPWEVTLALGPPGGSALNALRGPVSRVSGVGNRVRVTVASQPAVVAELTEASVGRLGLFPGVEVVATWKATGTRLVARSVAG